MGGVVEWVAWYRALGFTDILILTNDCTDHSPQLLDLLEGAGWLTHERVTVPGNKYPTPYKLRHALNHPLLTTVNWILLCDIDEFLVLHEGMTRISDLLPEPDPPFLSMLFNWRAFGTGGNLTWEDGLVHRQFTRAGDIQAVGSRCTKSVFRRPDPFGQLGAHGPYKLKHHRAKRLVGDGWS